MAAAEFGADAVGEREFAAVSFGFQAGDGGLEVLDFGFALAQYGKTARIVELQQDLVFFDQIASLTIIWVMTPASRLWMTCSRLLGITLPLPRVTSSTVLLYAHTTKTTSSRKNRMMTQNWPLCFSFCKAAFKSLMRCRSLDLTLFFAHNDESSVSVCCFQRGRLKRFLLVFSRRPFPFSSCLRRFAGTLVFLRLLCCFDFVLLVLHQFLQH